MIAPQPPSTVARDRRVEVRPCDAARAAELGRALAVSPTLAQVLLHRGMTDAASANAYFEPSIAGLNSPDAMHDRDAAADRLASAIRNRERIVVFGDYDADGTTSTVILTDVLEALGADVVPVLASRFAGGYGFSMPALERCLALGPRVVVTCDCGSSDHERIALARSRGVDVVVIDHHLVPAEPLPAFAFLNPHRPECGFPYKGMASAGLAFSVAAAVRARIQPKLDMRPYLDLVALGTIGDVAPLDGDNRRLVRAGLARLGGGECRPGIAALIEVAGAKRGVPFGARDVSFKLTPRINAPGRLGDPTLALELLRARSAVDARALASAVDRANQDRRSIEARITDEALAQVAAYAGNEPAHAVVASGETYHRGVVGISAARIAERFLVPAAAIAVEDGMGHGSIRSYAGADVHALLGRAKDLLEGYGGHAAAAGFTIRAERIDALREVFREAGLSGFSASGPSDAARGPVADLEIGSEFPLPRASELQRLEPVGAANEPMRVVLTAEVTRSREVGSGSHRKLDLRVAGQTLGGFARASTPGIASAAGQVTFVGTLVPDSFRGGEAIQLEVEAVC